jgi:hypothetical protein
MLAKRSVPHPTAAPLDSLIGRVCPKTKLRHKGEICPYLGALIRHEGGDGSVLLGTVKEATRFVCLESSSTDVG